MRRALLEFLTGSTEHVQCDYNLRLARHHKIRQALLHFAIGALLQNATKFFKVQ